MAISILAAAMIAGAALITMPGDRPPMIRASDYPKGALARGEGGTVVVLVTVGLDGKPTACEVARSSGSAELDATSCALTIQRGRYRVPKDASGTPIVSRREHVMGWRLPQHMVRIPTGMFFPTPAEREPEVTVTVETDKAGGCRVVASSGNEGADRRACGFAMQRADHDGQFGRRDFRNWIAPPLPPGYRPAVPTGEKSAFTGFDVPRSLQSQTGKGVIVTVRTVIGATRGPAKLCEVITPSGNVDVDRIVCETFTGRYRYEPATIDGRPVEETRYQSIGFLVPVYR